MAASSPPLPLDVNRRTLVAAALAGGLGLAWLLGGRGPSFRDRVVLVTGGSRGLGLELARRFAAEGACLGLLARSEEGLERAARELPPERVELLPCDLRDAAAVERAVARLHARFGGLDVLVNNAGIIQVAPFADLALHDFEEAMAINFFGALHTVTAALPYLRRSPLARIVNITSIGGTVPVPHMLSYVASKFAFVGFSQGLHAELAREGIRVTTVTPGLMRTGSAYRALFGGRQGREYEVFLQLDSLPGVSMAAGRAARRIIEACRQGRPVLAMPSYTRLAQLSHAFAPGTYARTMALLARMLPSPALDLDGAEVEGRDIGDPEESGPVARNSLRAARRNNELPAEED